MDDYFACYGFAGSYFIVFGIWNLVFVCRRFHTSRRRGLRYSSGTSYSWEGSRWQLLRDHPMESFIKIVVLASGMVLEILLGAEDGWTVSGLRRAKFATIYFFFGISSLIDVFIHYSSFSPFNLDYLCLLFSFFVEWILIRFPKHGDWPQLEDLLYTLLEYVIFITVVTVAMEMQCRGHAIPAIIRSYFMLLQGTWFWQISFILWKPSFGLPWKHDDEGDLTLACLFFVWHCGGNLVLVVLISGLVTCFYRGGGVLQQNNKDEMQMKSLIKPKRNGQTIISLGSYDDDDDDDDETDIEFPRRHK